MVRGGGGGGGGGGVAEKGERVIERKRAYCRTSKTYISHSNSRF